MATIFGRIIWGISLLATAMGVSLLYPGTGDPGSGNSPSAIFITPAKGVVMVGEEVPFALDMTTKSAVNAAEGAVLIRGTEVKFKRVLSKDSFLTIWVSEPSVNKTGSEIRFAGGTPSPGFTGRGAILRGSFAAEKAGKVFLSIQDSQVFLNDGKGTGVVPAVATAEYAVFPRGTLTPDLNSDGVVDRIDMNILFTAWGRRGLSQYDLNKDGVVGAADLSTVLFLMRAPESRASSPSGLLYIWRSLASFVSVWR